MPFLSPSASLKGLAEDDADVFHRVMEIDVDIPLRLHLQIKQPMTGKEVEHVVEERDRSADLRLPFAVEIEGEADLGLLGYPFDRGLHGT
jgi:hypothetical protein